MDKINILGINVSYFRGRKDVLSEIEGYMENTEGKYIVTPNPEIVLEANRDEELFYIVNCADLAIPDGIGLKFASFTLGKNLTRFSGSDLTVEILKRSKEKRVAVLIPENSLSSKEDIEKSIKKIRKDIKVKIFKHYKQDYKEMPESLENFNPHVLFVTFGAPYQEKFIYHNNEKIKSLKLAIGVGGTFDFLTGKIKRAPKFLRFIGLEWIWRFYKEPKRVSRIFDAVVVFSLKFINWRFILPFFYRPNVACMLYKKVKGDYKIFLVERSREKGHWQIPQGGTEGESLMEAGKKELQEELNTDKFKAVGTFKNISKYKIPRRIINDEPTRHKGYKGQKQGLFIAEFTGEDKDIKINYWDHRNWKWVSWKKIVEEVHPTRKESMRVALDYFKSEIINNEKI